LDWPFPAPPHRRFGRLRRLRPRSHPHLVSSMPPSVAFVRIYRGTRLTPSLGHAHRRRTRFRRGVQLVLPVAFALSVSGARAFPFRSSAAGGTILGKAGSEQQDENDNTNMLFHLLYQSACTGRARL